MDAQIRAARGDDVDAVLAVWASADVEPTVTDDRGSMWRLAVRPDHRRQGIAQALVATAEQRLQALGATRIATFVVTTDDTPSGFWAACGYQAQTHRRRFVKNVLL